MPDTLQDLLGSLQSNSLLTSPRPAIREDLPQVSPQNSVTDILEDLHANPLLSERPTQIPEQRHIDRRLESEREQWRSFYQNQGEHPVEYIGRRALPFSSAIGGFLDSREYGAALRRIQSGSPQDGDYDTVGRYEARQQNDANRGTLGQIGSGLTHIPALVGEAAIGGMALRGAGLGGQAAAQVAERGPSLLSSAGLRALGSEVGANALQAARSPAAWGRNAATTATIPSMYLEGWAQRATEAGRDPWSPESAFRDLPPAFALGFMQTAVLGSLGKVGNEIPGTGLGPTLQRLAARTGTGVGEQQVIDVLAGAAHLQTGYGAIGDLIQGKFGDALKHATVQAVTFAAFSALHPVLHGEHQSPTEAYQRILRSRSAQGLTAASSARVANAAADRLAEALEHNPWLTRAQARELFKNERSQFVRRWGESLADALPEHLAPFQSRRGEPTANPLRPQGAPETAPLPQTTPTVAPQGVANGNGLPSTASIPRAGISSPGAPSLAEATMPVQAAPDAMTGQNQGVPGQVQRNPIPKAYLFGLAEFFGIKTKIGKKERSLQEIVAEIRSQPGGENLLRSMDEQFNPAPKPQIGPTAEERAKFGVDAANPEPTLAEQGATPPVRSDPSPPAPPSAPPVPAVPERPFTSAALGKSPTVAKEPIAALIERAIRMRDGKGRARDLTREGIDELLADLKAMSAADVKRAGNALGVAKGKTAVGVIDSIERSYNDLGSASLEGVPTRAEEAATKHGVPHGPNYEQPLQGTMTGQNQGVPGQDLTPRTAPPVRPGPSPPAPPPPTSVPASGHADPTKTLPELEARVRRHFGDPQKLRNIVDKLVLEHGVEAGIVKVREKYSSATASAEYARAYAERKLFQMKIVEEVAMREEIRSLPEVAKEAGLTENEAKVVIDRFVGGKTLGQIGKEIGFSKVAAKQNEQRGLEKLKIEESAADFLGTKGKQELSPEFQTNEGRSLTYEERLANAYNAAATRIERNKPKPKDNEFVKAYETQHPEAVLERQSTKMLKEIDKARTPEEKDAIIGEWEHIWGKELKRVDKRIEVSPETTRRDLEGSAPLAGSKDQGESGNRGRPGAEDAGRGNAPESERPNEGGQLAGRDAGVGPAGDLGQGVNTKAQRLPPQAREEFLRDVIATMRGLESPGFHPNQAEVQAEAARRLSAAETAKEKRTAINQAEKDWQEAKSEAAIQNEGRINPAEPMPPAEHRTVGGTFGEGPLIRTGSQRTIGLSHESIRETAREKTLAEIDAASRVQGDEMLWNRAREAVRNDPRLPARIAEEVISSKGDRALNTTEKLILEHRRTSVRNEIGQLEKQGYGGEAISLSDAAYVLLGRRMKELFAEQDLVDKALHVSGSESGRGLRIQRLMNRFDYTLEGLLGRAAITKGERLTEAEVKRITELQSKLEDLQNKLEAAEGKLKDRPTSDTPEGGTVPRDITVLRAETKAAVDAIIREMKAFEDLHQTPFQRTLGVAKETSNFLRGLITSFDLSALLRQGGVAVWANPKLFAPALGKSLKSLASKEHFGEFMQEMRDSKNGLLYEKMRLHFSDNHTKLEEMVQGKWAEKIEGLAERFGEKHAGPTAGKIAGLATGLAASQRAYSAGLNSVRRGLADVFIDAFAGKGLGGKVLSVFGMTGKMTDSEARVIGNLVNIATGRGNVGKFEQAASAMSHAFFAPYYVVSRFQLLVGQPLWHGTARTRILIGMEYAKYLAGLGALYAIARVLGDDKTLTFDPRSADFGKLRFGDTRIDPLSGLSQSIVATSRALSGQSTNAQGRVIPLRGQGVRFGGRDVMDVLSTFVRSKLAPLPGAGVNVAVGRDVVGQPVTATSTAADLVVPIVMRDIYEAMTGKLGFTPAMALSLLAILGMGVQTYEQRVPRPR